LYINICTAGAWGVGNCAEERRKESCGCFNLLVLWYLWEIKSKENSIGRDLSCSYLCCGGNAQMGCSAIAVLPKGQKGIFPYAGRKVLPFTLRSLCLCCS